MPIDLRPLRHFEAIHRLRSFRLAAEEQALTQSAITRSLQRLEAELELRLFDRTTRAVVPTPAGDHLVERARTLIRQADELEREARLLRGAEAGAVRIGAEPMPTEALIAPALGRFAEAHAGATVEVSGADQNTLVERLLARDLDFVVLGGLAFEAIRFVDEILIQHLPSEPAVIVARAGHPLVRSKAPSEAYLEDAWAAPRLSASEYARLPEPFRSEAEKRGIPQLRLESVSACLQLAEQSRVLTGAPLSVALRAEARAGVELVAFPFRLETSYAILTHRHRTLGGAADAMRDEVRQSAREAARGAEAALARISSRSRPSAPAAS